jgi:hypothetical protein
MVHMVANCGMQRHELAQGWAGAGRCLWRVALVHQ